MGERAGLCRRCRLVGRTTHAAHSEQLSVRARDPGAHRIDGVGMLRRWFNESPTSVPPWVAAADLADLRARLTAVESEQQGFLADLTDAGLEQMISYRTVAGQPHEDRLSD